MTPERRPTDLSPALDLFVTPALRLLQAELRALEALLPGHAEHDETRFDAAFEAETDNLPV